MLPEKIRMLDVSIGNTQHSGQLIKSSNYEFRYLSTDSDQPEVALLMPPSQQLTWQDADLFAPMDQNLPEGDLFMRIRALYPKQPMLLFFDHENISYPLKVQRPYGAVMSQLLQTSAAPFDGCVWRPQCGLTYRPSQATQWPCHGC